MRKSSRGLAPRRSKSALCSLSEAAPRLRLDVEQMHAAFEAGDEGGRPIDEVGLFDEAGAKRAEALVHGGE
jgi:hypothetical protein